jgi:hypothetical protein
MEPFPTLNAKDSADAPPERLLLSWLDQYFAMFTPPGPGWIWRLRASALRRYLLAPEHPWSEQAARVLTSPDAVGVYLEKLQRLFPHRFRKMRTSAENLWQISPSPIGNSQTLNHSTHR